MVDKENYVLLKLKLENAFKDYLDTVYEGADQIPENQRNQLEKAFLAGSLLSADFAMKSSQQYFESSLAYVKNKFD